MFSLSSSLESRGQFLVDSESTRKFKKTKTGCTLFPELRDKERTQSSCSTWQNRRTEKVPQNLEWRCCKKVDSQGGHFTGIHDGFLRNPVYRESQLVIGWTEQKYKEMDELAKEDHTCQKIPRTMISQNKSAKMGLWNFDPIFELLSPSKIVYTASQTKKLKSPFLQKNTGDDIPLQAHRGGTSLNGIGNELIKFVHSDLLFVTVGFVYCRWRSTVTDGLSRQIHLTRHFSHAVCTFNYMHITLHDSRRATQRVFVRASFHLLVIHDGCLTVCCLSLRVCSSSVSLCRLPLLFLTLPVLCPALHLQCQQCCAFAEWGVLPHGDIQSSHMIDDVIIAFTVLQIHQLWKDCPFKEESIHQEKLLRFGWASGQSTLTMRGILALKSKRPSEMICVRFPRQSLVQQVGKTEDLQMHHRMAKSGMVSKKSLHSIKHTSFHTELFKIKGHHWCPENKLLQKLRHQLEDTFQRCTQSTVTLRGLRQAKASIKELDAHPWTHLVNDSPSVPSIEFCRREPWARKRSEGHHVGTFEINFKRITRTRCIFLISAWAWSCRRKKSLDEKLPSVVIDTGRRYADKQQTRVRKTSSVPN